MKTAALFASTLLVALGLTGCGGGGGGQLAKTYSLVAPAMLSSYPSTGTPSSTTPRTDYGTAQISFTVTTDSSTSYAGYTSTWRNFGPTAHLDDPDVARAWGDGWTGLGTSISIIDDFSTNSSRYYSTTTNHTRSKTETVGYGYYTASYSISYKQYETVSHGGWVSNIAGADYTSSPVVEAVSYEVPSDALVSGTCNSVITSTYIYAYAPNCDSRFHNWYSFSPKISGTRTRILIPGIAGQALVTNNNVNLSSRQDPIKTVADIQGHLKNSASYDVINLSLGVEVPTTGKTYEEIMAEVENVPLSSKVNAVITVAAGNGGAPCANSDLSGCNAVAVALAYQEETRNTTIVVGALSGTGSQENIATYSTRAGILAQRFVLANGTIGFFDSVVGTSFAAPRVAGIAALIKHKYPSLTSAQVANIILLSASKDINNDGRDDFTGVSPIYGHGKASLSRALALAGSI